MDKPRFSPPWPELPSRLRRSFGAEAAGALRAAVRLLLLLPALDLLAGAAALSRLAGPAARGRRSADRFASSRRHRRLYCRLVLRLLGGRTAAAGDPPAGPCLIVADHHSWLDGLAVLAAAGPAFVAYDRPWPLIGFLMRSLGMVRVPRGLGRELPLAVAATAAALAAGDRVAVFPEGTTGFGPEPLEFRPAFFQAAIDAGVPVRPAALAYATPEPWPSPERVLHWVDWTPFVVHACRILALPRWSAALAFGPALARTDRRRQAAEARAAVVAAAPAAAAAARRALGRR
jgi:1-acyl-sn-glycerol-3-phosphate acyltransferase